MFYVRTIDIILAKRDNVVSISLHRLSQEISANKDVYTLLHIILLFWHTVIKFKYYFENGFLEEFLHIDG